MATTNITSSLTPPLSSAGIGSGLDVASIIQKLMAVEDAPLNNLQTAAASIQSNISAFGSIQSTMATFRDASLALSNSSTWAATLGTSSDTTAVTVATTSGATPGNYSIQVNKLAASQSIATGVYSSSTASAGSGSIHIDLGSWNGDNSAFTQQSGTTGLDIVVDSTDTLSNVRDKINAANAGVTASIVTDATGSRMVLSSTATGVNNGFRVSTSGDATLGNLAYDPASGVSGGSTLTQAAANASATINGLTVSSASNTLSNVVQGMTLSLVKEGGTSQVTVATDTTSITAAIKSFVTAYNSISSLIATDTKYDAGSKTAGPLQGDSTATALQRQLRSVMGSFSNASSVYSTLSQVGLQVQTDGSITVNDSTLSSSLGNLSEMQKLFANSDATDGTQDGFATRMASLGDAVLGSDGMLTTRTAGLNTSLKDNEDRQADMQTRLDATQARLTAQYTALDTQMATLTTLSNYVTQQIANWNKA